jgi:hypothetical protein
MSKELQAGQIWPAFADFADEKRDEGVPRGPGGPPHVRGHEIPPPDSMLRHG